MEHLLEQYFTRSQFNFHFFLQENGFLQTRQILNGKFCFFISVDFYFLKIKSMQRIHKHSEKEKKEVLLKIILLKNYILEFLTK